MLRQLHKRWWKILGAVLVLLSVVAGLIFPVGPSIRNVEVISDDPQGPLRLHIYSYYADLTEPTVQVFLKNSDDNYICAQNVQVLDQDELIADFVVPMMEDRDVRVLINNSTDGTLNFINEIRVEPHFSEARFCQPTVLTNDATYFHFPYRIVLYETIRNLFFHVPMWFAMTFTLLLSFIFTLKFLNKKDERYDVMAAQCANVAILFGVLGFLTGALWGNFTWGQLDKWLLQDTKILGALIGLVIYFAYFILRGSIENEEQRGRISGVFNVFAFFMYITFIFVVPRLTETLHPGSGGNPAFNIYDVDDNMRPVFYSAVVGWILIAMWIVSIKYRFKMLQLKLEIAESTERVESTEENDRFSGDRKNR